jgi:hypothetical protein
MLTHSLTSVVMGGQDFATCQPSPPLPPRLGTLSGSQPVHPRAFDTVKALPELGPQDKLALISWHDRT